MSSIILRKSLTFLICVFNIPQTMTLRFNLKYMELGFYFLLIALGLNMFFCILYLCDKSFYKNFYHDNSNYNFARWISWLNVIAGAIFVVGCLTLQIYNLI